MYEAKVNGGEGFEISSDHLKNLLKTGGQTDVRRVDDHTFHVLENGNSYKIFVAGVNAEEKTVALVVNGKKASVSLSTEMDRLLRKLGISTTGGSRAADIKAPMPGMIHSIAVAEGMKVSKGETVLILEAMKMENVIKAQADAVVARIHVKKGESVDKGHLLISFEK